MGKHHVSAWTGSNWIQVAKLCKLETADWPELSFAVSRSRPGTSALAVGDEPINSPPVWLTVLGLCPPRSPLAPALISPASADDAASRVLCRKVEAEPASATHSTSSAFLRDALLPWNLAKSGGSGFMT
jgi:hypothetical protein